MPTQIFRPPSPPSPGRDPFLHSPTASLSHPHLRGSSRSPSPTRTPPFPGPGIDGIPNIDDDDGLGSGIGVGLLFAEPSASASRPGKAKRSVKSSIPNPYAPSDSDEEVEADLDEVANVRRSLMKKSSRHTDRKKGWMAHQSVFPPSSASSSNTESDKETEPDSETDGRSRMMGLSRYHKTKSQRQASSESGPPPYVVESALDEPLLGPDELESRGTSASVPIRLQVYHGRFGHWQREGLRKYKGEQFGSRQR